MTESISKSVMSKDELINEMLNENVNVDEKPFDISKYISASRKSFERFKSTNKKLLDTMAMSSEVIN